MSIDFLTGFTIFILAFIWVATMIPGILIGLQAYTIDYDAVAYRTGVLLVEDPGWNDTPGWETLTDQQKIEMTRLGLASSKDTPNILSESKVNRFFNTTTFTYPQDYQTRLIFGDYPYKFNISLHDNEKNETKVIGDLLPDGYGHIRRLVKIKSMSNATINESYILTHKYTNTENVSEHQFSIVFNNTKLLGEQPDPLYQINPATDPITINVSDFRNTLFYSGPPDPHVTKDQVNITLTRVFVYKGSPGNLSPMGNFDNIYLDDDSTKATLPQEVDHKVTLKITPDYIYGIHAEYTNIYFNYTFYLSTGGPNVGNTPPVCTPPCLEYKSPFLNNTFARAPPFDYNYNPANVTQPRLRDATVEVSVW
jgi:hypothetical protein